MTFWIGIYLCLIVLGFVILKICGWNYHRCSFLGHRIYEYVYFNEVGHTLPVLKCKDCDNEWEL